MAAIAATLKPEPATKQKLAPQSDRPRAPKAPSIFNRPLPRTALSGVRHVPRFVSAMGVPFLRMRKPQPPALSNIIRQRHRRKQSWHVYADAQPSQPLPPSTSESPHPSS